jgi:uncharacterized protein
MKPVLVIIACVVLCAGLPAHAIVDCSKPKSNVERLLCTSDRLAIAEQLMAVAFRDAFYRTADKDALVKDQEHWRETVRDACNDVPCLLEAYQRRTLELETY